VGDAQRIALDEVTGFLAAVDDVGVNLQVVDVEGAQRYLPQAHGVRVSFVQAYAGLAPSRTKMAWLAWYGYRRAGERSKELAASHRSASRTSIRSG